MATISNQNLRSSSTRQGFFSWLLRKLLESRLKAAMYRIAPTRKL